MTNLVLAVMILSSGVDPSTKLNTRLGYEREAQIILEVAQEYQLDVAQTKLMVCLRRCENGDPDDGNEFGVAHERPKHPSHRYKGKPEKSLRLQARWAAGTVRVHYGGDLLEFCRTWCPKNYESLTKNVGKYMAMK